MSHLVFIIYNETGTEADTRHHYNKIPTHQRPPNKVTPAPDSASTQILVDILQVVVSWSPGKEGEGDEGEAVAVSPTNVSEEAEKKTEARDVRKPNEV